MDSVPQKTGCGPVSLMVHYEDGKEGAHGVMWFYDTKDTPESFAKKHGITEYHVFKNIPSPEQWTSWENHIDINPYEVHLYKISDCKECLEICTDKCKNHFANELRQARNNQLQKLDGEYMKCLETGSDPSEILRLKNTLRNMPVSPLWDTCCTKEDFEKVTIDDVVNHNPSTTTQ
jgi:hypothetical protein